MKMFLRVTAFFLLTGFLCISGVFAENAAEGLKFTIKFDRTVFTKGEPVTCKMELTNTGKEPVYVNKRFLVNWPSPSYHEVYFVIKKDKGGKLKFQQRVRAGDPTANDFVKLMPGGSVESGPALPFADYNGFDLSEAYGLTAPGKYKIYAVYENRAELIGLKTWTGSIKSETIDITIK